MTGTLVTSVKTSGWSFYNVGITFIKGRVQSGQRKSGNTTKTLVRKKSGNLARKLIKEYFFLDQGNERNAEVDPI